MRNWLWLAAALVVGLLIFGAVRAQEIDYDFAADKASRIAYIDDEFKVLHRERACILKARNRPQMRLCNR